MSVPSDKRRTGIPTGLLILSAVVGPPIVSVLFNFVFVWIARTFDPQGNLEGRDLSMYAYRDLALFGLFGLTLLAFVFLGARRARTDGAQLAFVLVGTSVSLATLFVTFFAMMAR